MWQFWIDVGGTFTDCIGRSPDGQIVASKVLSSGRLKANYRAGRLEGLTGVPHSALAGWTVEAADGSIATLVEISGEGDVRFGGDLPSGDLPHGPVELFCDDLAPVIAIRLTLGLRPDDRIPPLDLKLGTTRGTNALLERKGARVGLLTTKGFADTLEIGTQQRPDLFALTIRKTCPLTHAVAEVNERVAADGSVVTPIDLESVRKGLAKLATAGCETIAIAFVNSYRNAEHERAAAAITREFGFNVVSQSAELSRSIQFLPRAETAVLDAYLEPTLRTYLETVESSLPGSEIRFMTSAGGLSTPPLFRGVASLLSGPAGGVVGCSDVALAAGLYDGADAFDGAIGFDMGGTSTDVCRVDRVTGIARVREAVKAGVRVAASTVAIETVAAGGGSICGFDGVKLTVGPESAGADPGPACYGRGGPLTVTDCNVLLGRVVPTDFPFPLDVDASRTRLQELKRKIIAADPTGDVPADDQLARGLFRIATENMANAVRQVTVSVGRDPARDALVTFGGAGGQYACAIADELGCRAVVVHPYAGLLSAYGIGRANERFEHSEAALVPLTEFDQHRFNRLRADLISKSHGLCSQGHSCDLETTYEMDLRYQGTEASLTLGIEPNESADEIAGRFHQSHKSRYGYDRDRGIEVVNLRVVLTLRGDRSRLEIDTERWPDPPAGTSDTFVTLADPFSTTVIDPGWNATRLSNGSLVMRRVEQAAETQCTGTDSARRSSEEPPTAVRLELFHSRFGGIADHMGAVLRNTSVSTNVKERLDYSCALFDDEGRLIVNAPHIPVHLGAMGETVKHLIVTQTIRAGDIFVTNDPYRGGSHLPDVTVVTPLFVAKRAASSAKPNFYLASRAHHAEIGGVVPGSIPPNSKTLAEEGVLIRDFRLVDAGVDQTDALAALLASPPHPSRNVADNLADIAAQAAANQAGAAMLLTLVKREGFETVRSMMSEIRDAAARKTIAAINVWSKQRGDRFHAVDVLDDGTPIEVAIRLGRGSAVFDFSGTGAVVTSNLNANRGIVTAAVLYVLRLLIGRVDTTAESMPLNEGVLDPVTIVLPECVLNPPVFEEAEQCAAVVGGNTETSQRVVDVLMTALQLAACSQGTMNNVTFGNDRFGYYETIAGGSGATSRACGASGVQVHMTNTRMTDAEVLEHRYPVRVHAFGLRRGSGGIGRYRGGDGIVREIEFLAPLSLSLLTGRRETEPPGADDGGPGQRGRNTRISADGTETQLAWREHCDMSTGDRLRIETPGGGAWGRLESDG